AAIVFDTGVSRDAPADESRGAYAQDAESDDYGDHDQDYLECIALCCCRGGGGSGCGGHGCSAFRTKLGAGFNRRAARVTECHIAPQARAGPCVKRGVYRKFPWKGLMHFWERSRLSKNSRSGAAVSGTCPNWFSVLCSRF